YPLVATREIGRVTDLSEPWGQRPLWAGQHGHSARTVRANRSAVRLRRTNRRRENLQTIAAKHVVKCCREFLVAIPDQKPERFRTPGERPGEPASQLGHPSLTTSAIVKRHGVRSGRRSRLS